MRRLLVAVLTLISFSSGASQNEGYRVTPATQAFLLLAPRISFVDDPTPIPGNFSMRGKAGPVEDQGSCHSCWDFALTTALRGTLMLQGQDPGRLSFNYLLNCNGLGMTCDSGDFTAAEMLLNPHGPPAYGADGAYTQTEGQCEKLKPLASATSYKLLGTDFGQHPKAPTPSFKDIAYALAILHRPVAVDVDADWSWDYYSSGIFDDCSSGEMNHMVVIEGYSCESSLDKSGNCAFDKSGNLQNGVGYWVVRNSHGAGYGDHGYIKIKATAADGSKCNSIATDALYFE